MIRIESAIDKCLRRLDERLRLLSPDNDWQTLNDDVESIASLTHTSRSRTRMLSASREAELLKQKVRSLELENMDLRKNLEQIQKMLRMAPPSISKNESLGILPHKFELTSKDNNQDGHEDKSMEESSRTEHYSIFQRSNDCKNIEIDKDIFWTMDVRNYIAQNSPDPKNSSRYNSSI